MCVVVYVYVLHVHVSRRGFCDVTSDMRVWGKPYPQTCSNAESNEDQFLVST